MKELREVLAAASRVIEPMALATVVSVDGSSYRRPGARMLMTASGPVAGSVSGGCLEADVLEHARGVIASGEPCLLTYDTRADDDALFGLGTGCAGLIQILVERVTPDHAALRLPGSWVGQREPAVLATVIDADDKTRIGERVLEGPSAPNHGGAGLGHTDSGSLLLGRGGSLAQAAREALAKGVSETRMLAEQFGRMRVFLEVLAPPLALVVCGAGSDALPLTRLASELGWRVTVADHRPAYATAARFPGADAVVVSRPEHLRAHLTLDSRTAVVLMTHHYGLDSALLSALSDASIAYLGLLGSMRRTERILGDLQASDPERFAAIHERLHAPIGLDLGATTPEEIALSIVAEIKAVTTGRAARSLRSRRAPVSSDPCRSTQSRGNRTCAIAG